MARHWPRVVLACACEKVLQEKDNVITLVRVIDTFHVPSEGNSTELPPSMKVGIDFWFVVSLRTEALKGAFELALELHKPDGTAAMMFGPKTVEVDALPQVNVLLRSVIETTLHGSYWLSVLWDAKSIAKIPFRLVEKPPATPTDQRTLSESAPQ